MSKFLTLLDAKIGKQWEQISENKRRFQRVVTLNKSLYYESDLLGTIIKVPRGFVSDGASVPKLLWNIYPPFGKYLEAAIVHDWYCVLGHKGESPIDYKMAAELFKEAMKVCGVSKWRRNKMYWAVRLGGPKFQARQGN